MNWFKAFLPRFLSGRRRLETQFDSELRFHIDELTDANIAAGMTPAEARRRALAEFGGQDQVKEDLRDIHRSAPLEHAAANLKYALRTIRKSPSFSLTIILTLALGIGANSAVFSAIDAILFRPLAFPDGDRLVRLRQHNSKAKIAQRPVAPARVEDWNRLNSTLEAITGYYTEDVSETSGDVPELVSRAFVTARFLQVCGVPPALGRGFTRQEEAPGGPSAVLISDRFWRRRFNADPHALGKLVRTGKSSSVIVGVMPASFSLPSRDVDLWFPVQLGPPFAENRDLTWYTVVGRLKPGATLDGARANLATVQAQLAKAYPASDAGITVEVESLKETTVGEVRGSLWLLFGSVSLLLLIACANIAALLLARARDREREISVRLSLGASRMTVIWQLLTESFVLALAGSAIGLAVAGGAPKLFRSLAKNLPRVEEITLDWRIALYTLACAVAATLLFGLFPAIQGTRRGIAGSLAHGSRTQVSTHNRVQTFLVGTQVALAVTLLVGAGLLLRSFQAIGRIAPGFDSSRILTLRMSGSYAETVDMKGLAARIDRTLEAIRNVPGVEAAATAAALPGTASPYQTEFKFAEGEAEPGRKITADGKWVSAGYFQTLGIPMLAGEPCQPTTANIVVVNRAFVNAFLSESPVIGRHIQPQMKGWTQPFSEIRGIAADVRENGLTQEPAPTVYSCYSAPRPDPYFIIRTHGQPMAMAGVLRGKIRELEPARSVFDVATLDEHLSDTFAENRLRTILLTLFAVTAASLACVGLYGTLSYLVSIRHREIGLRLALGSLRGQILARFLLQGLLISVLGCIAGLSLAAASVRVLSGMLYGVSASDAATFAGVALLVLAVAALASALPASRAARVQPIEALRDE